ncbi:MAG TPA: helix-turn-helix domain-containing protein [Steroidobacteraceae bacterium]
MSRRTTGCSKGRARPIATPIIRRSLTDVIYVVAEHYGVSPSELLGNGCGKLVAEARSVAYALSRDLTPASLPEIGEVFSRDHSTVMTMVQRVAERAMKNNSFAFSIAVCRARAVTTIRARRLMP